MQTNIYMFRAGDFCTCDWAFENYWLLEKAFFLCGDVGFELLNIPMKYTDGQHLDNQLVWF